MRTGPAVILGALVAVGLYTLFVFGRLWSPTHASPASATSDSPVSMTEQLTFVPKTITVTVGTTITWTNTATTNIPHTTTSDDGTSWDSTTQFPTGMSPGQSFSVTFNTPGTFAYHCLIHGGSGGLGMAGTVVVQDVAPTTTSTPATTGTPTATSTSAASPVGTRSVFLPAVFNGFGGLTQAVSLVDFAFQPNPITIPQGTTVTWTNTTASTTHTVTADDGSFDSQDLSAGHQFSVTFASAGTFRYYCKIHGGPGGVGMSGTITVTSGTAGASW